MPSVLWRPGKVGGGRGGGSLEEVVKVGRLTSGWVVWVGRFALFVCV